MLKPTMSLKEMIETRPQADALPADGCVVKCVIIADSQAQAYALIRTMMDAEHRDSAQVLFTDCLETVYYDFDGTAHPQGRFIVASELAGTESWPAVEQFFTLLYHQLTDPAELIVDIFSTAAEDPEKPVRRLYSEAGQLRCAWIA